MAHRSLPPLPISRPLWPQPLGTYLLSRSPWRAASRTCTWRVAPLEARTEATQAESGRALGAHRSGCGSTGRRRAREARGRRGKVHGTSRRGAAPAPSRTRTQRAGCTVPAPRPRGHCGQRPARQARASSAPGLLGLAPGRGGAPRSLFKGKAWSEGCYAAGGRGVGVVRGEPGTHASSLLRSCHLSSRPLRAPSVFPGSQALPGRTQVLKAQLPSPALQVHPGLTCRERPGPETPSSRLEPPL